MISVHWCRVRTIHSHSDILDIEHLLIGNKHSEMICLRLKDSKLRTELN